MCFIDRSTASRSALDLAARLASCGRTRADAQDVIEHLAAWEPDTAPVAVRIIGSEFVVTTASGVSPATTRLLKAYAPPGATVVFHVVEAADAE